MSHANQDALEQQRHAVRVAEARDHQPCELARGAEQEQMVVGDIGQEICGGWREGVGEEYWRAADPGYR